MSNRHATSTVIEQVSIVWTAGNQADSAKQSFPDGQWDEDGTTLESGQLRNLSHDTYGNAR